MSIGLVITLFLLIVIIRFIPFYTKEHFNPIILQGAFLLKFTIGIVLIWIHEHVYRMDDFSHDGQRFLREGEYLYNVFKVSALDYFKLLSGIGESQELINKYLYMTNYWSTGDLTLINDSKNVIRIHSLIHFFSGGNRLIHVALFCFMSFIGLIALHKGISRFIKLGITYTFLFILLIPSTLFWSSSMMKEPFLFLGIGLFCFGLLSESSLIKRIFCLVVSLILLIGFKPYILVCLIVTLIFVFWYNFLKQRFILSVGAFLILFVSLAFALPSSRISVVHYLTRKQFDFINVGKGGLHVQADSTYYFFEPHQYKNLKMSDGFVELQVPTKALYYRFGSKESPHSVFLTPTGKKWPIVYFKPGCESYIEIKRIDESAIQLIKNIPEALFNTFLRPLPWDNGSDLKYLAMVEVWLIIGIIILSVVQRRKLNKTEKNVLVGLLSFALLLFILIGWTTPVIGAIARYRFPAQLAVILGCLILIDTSKWRKNSR